MLTTHRIFLLDSRKMEGLEECSIDLVVTSPPYPMIEMWDEQFVAMNPAIKDYLDRKQGHLAFEAMHALLDQVWQELQRVMKEGAIACINIGDATRTINKRFQLYANHARIQNKFFELGFDLLPLIIWRKQTNAPNKFMGSGMLPASAYVTLEHEYILIFRKGPKRSFATKDQKNCRLQSSFFWEERNTWFSDLWSLKGTRQDIDNRELRNRSAAFPFLVPFRLINMYSVFGDTILDPFVGTGTSVLAAMAAGRNSVGCEIDHSFKTFVGDMISTKWPDLNRYNFERIREHLCFVQHYTQSKGRLKHYNHYFGFPVVTAQEKEMRLPFIQAVIEAGLLHYKVDYFEDQTLEKIDFNNLDVEQYRLLLAGIYN